MISEIYILRFGVQLGPYNEQELLTRVESNEISINDLYWRPGMSEWQQISSGISDSSSLVFQTATPLLFDNINNNTGECIDYSLPTYPGFWLRFQAGLSDVIIVGLSLQIIVALFPPLFPLVLIAGFLYHPLMESSSKQATIGQQTCKIRVTDLSGKKPAFRRALARHCCKIMSGLIFGLGFLMCIFTPKKQNLHDLLSGCVFEKTKKSKNSRVG